MSCNHSRLHRLTESDRLVPHYLSLRYDLVQQEKARQTRPLAIVWIYVVVT